MLKMVIASLSVGWAVVAYRISNYRINSHSAYVSNIKCQDFRINDDVTVREVPFRKFLSERRATIQSIWAAISTWRVEMMHFPLLIQVQYIILFPRRLIRVVLLYFQSGQIWLLLVVKFKYMSRRHGPIITKLVKK